MKNNTPASGLTDEERAFIKEIIQNTNANVYRRVKSKLRNFDHHYVEDCIQDIWLTLCYNIKAVMKHPCPEGWICKTASYIASEYSKRIIREQNHTGIALDGSSYDYIYEASETFENSFIEDIMYHLYMDARVIEKALSTLTKRESSLYEMRHKQKLSYKEMAKELNTSTDSARASVSYINKKIISSIKAETKNI